MANDFKRGIRVYLDSSDYGKGIDQMVASTKKYEKEIESLTTESKRMTAAGENSGKAWDDNQKKLKAYGEQVKKSQAVEADYRAKLQQTEKVLNNLSGVSYNELINVQKTLQKELKTTTRGTDEHKTKLDQLDKVNNEVVKSQKEMNSQLGATSEGFMEMAAGAAAGIAALSVVYSKLEEFMGLRMELEDSQANLKALTGLDDKDIGWLTNYAVQLSTTTTEAGIRITASSKEIMDGFTTIGSKRPELLKNKEAMAEVTKQALTLAAAGVPVETAFDVVTASMNQFNLGADQASRIINVLASGSLEGSAEADSLAGSLKNVGTVSKGSNLSLEQTVAALEVLASKQLLGEEAGTKLRGALLKMQAAGVGYVSGSFNMRDAIVEVNSMLDKQGTNLEKDALKQKLFGIENITAGQILLENVKEYERLTLAVTGTNVAMTQAQINTETTSAKLKQAKNNYNEAGIALAKNFEPALLGVTNAGVSLLKVFVQHPALLYTLVTAVGLLTVAMTYETVASIASTLALKAKASATDFLNSKTVLFFKTLLTNPYVLIGAAIAGVTLLIYKLASAQTAANAAWKEYNKQSAIEIENSNQLFEAAKKTNIGTDERKIAIDKINSIYGKYLTNQLTEKSNLNDLTIAQNQVNNALREKIAIQTKEQAKADVITKRIPLQANLMERISNNVSGSKGEATSDVIMKTVKDILDKNTPADPKKAYTLAKDYLKRMMGKDMKDNMYSDLAEYISSLTNMNTELSDIDKKFDRILTKPKSTSGGGMGGPKEGDLSADGTMIFKGGKWVKIKKEKADGTLDKTDPYTVELKQKEEAYKESQLEVMEQRRKGEISEKVFNQIALQTQLSFLDEKKKLQEKYKKETVDTEIEISNQKLKIQQDGDAFALQAIKDIQDAGIKALESAQLTKQRMLQDTLNQGIITEKEYNSEIKKLAADLANAKLSLAEATLVNLKKVKFNDKDVQKKALTDAIDEIAKLKEALVNAQGAVAKDTAKGVEKDAETIAERMKKVFGNSFSEIGNLFTNFSQGLDDLSKGNLDSWSDWGTAVGGIVQSALSVATQVNDEYFKGKAASLEADKQRELTNAGSNAEERDKINQKYAQKELDLKKKQSSADTVLKVAQAVAAGGLAIMQGFAQLGPIGGVIAAVILGGITALQVGTILKQNEAIQNTTLDSSAMAGASPTPQVTGARVVTPQAADGRWDVMGADDGKVYRNVPYRGVARTGMVTTPTLMGERGDELIVDNPTLRNIRMNAPGVLDVIRRNRVRQRADGNYNTIDGSSPAGSSVPNQDNSAIIAANISVMSQLIALLSYLRDNGIDAFVMLSQLEKQQALKDKSLKKGSIKG